jgi:hypothetical protein
VPTWQILFCTSKGISFLVRLPQADNICMALAVTKLHPRPALRDSALRAICAHHANIILYPKSTSFLVHSPLADDICTAFAVKNLHPQPQLSSEGNMCPPGKYYFVPQKAHLFWCVSASGSHLYGAHGDEPASPPATPL